MKITEGGMLLIHKCTNPIIEINLKLIFICIIQNVHYK